MLHKKFSLITINIEEELKDILTLRNDYFYKTKARDSSLIKDQTILNVNLNLNPNESDIQNMKNHQFPVIQQQSNVNILKKVHFNINDQVKNSYIDNMNSSSNTNNSRFFNKHQSNTSNQSINRNIYFSNNNQTNQTNQNLSNSVRTNLLFNSSNSIINLTNNDFDLTSGVNRKKLTFSSDTNANINISSNSNGNFNKCVNFCFSNESQKNSIGLVDSTTPFNINITEEYEQKKDIFNQNGNLISNDIIINSLAKKNRSKYDDDE